MSYKNDLAKDQELGRTFKVNCKQLEDFQNQMKKIKVINAHLELQIKAKECEIRSLESINSGLMRDIDLQKYVLNSEVLNAEAEIIKERDNVDDDIA